MGTIKQNLANNILTDGKFDATDLSGNIPSSNVANASLNSITTLPSGVGTGITSVASDPPAPSEGQIWYNTTSDTLKAYQNVTINASIASGGNLNTGRGIFAGAGTQTAGLVFGGDTGPARIGETEEYNGTSWAEQNNLNTSRSALIGAGTQTAGLGAGGYSGGSRSESEEYNGTSWSEGNNIGSARYRASGCGTQTAALMAGGGGPKQQTEEYNGTSWTSVNNVPSFSHGAMVGLQTAAYAFGGKGPGSIDTGTKEYDGTNWTAGATISVGRQTLYGAGSTSSAVAAGGASDADSDVETNTVQEYNGTSWTTSAVTLPAAADDGADAGTYASGLFIGAGPGGPSSPSATNEWTGPSSALQVTTLATS